MIYYVYLYLDTRKLHEVYEHEPFYVGKGKGVRDMVHINTVDKDRTNLHKTNRIKAIIRDTGNIPKIIRIAEHLTEDEAYSIERDMIKKLGRVDLGTGCLLNLSMGGDGCSGMSKEGRRKLSDRMISNNPNKDGKHTKGKKRIQMTGENNYFYGKKWSDCDKARLSNLRKQEWKKNREKYCKEYRLVSPLGETYIVKTGIKYFAKEHNLPIGTLQKMINGYIPSSGKCVGWVIHKEK